MKRLRAKGLLTDLQAIGPLVLNAMETVTVDIQVGVAKYATITSLRRALFSFVESG